MERIGGYVNFSPEIENRILEKLLKCAIISPYIAGDKLISVMVIANAQLYKTGTLMKFSDNRGILVATDITYRELATEIYGEIKKGKIKTILIPDMLKTIMKKESTKANFTSALNSLIEEGVYKVYTGEDFGGIKANVISSITPDIWRDNRTKWFKIGFCSRFIPFSYIYDEPKKNQIYNAIGKYIIKTDEKIRVPLPINDEKINVKINNNQTKHVEIIAKRIIKSEGYFRRTKNADAPTWIGEDVAFRHQWHLQCILKCLALLDKREVVNDKDIKTLDYMSNWMNYDFNPLK